MFVCYRTDLMRRAWKITTNPTSRLKSNQGIKKGGSADPAIQLPSAPVPPTPLADYPAPNKPIQSATFAPFPFDQTDPDPGLDPDVDDEADENRADITLRPHRRSLLSKYAESLPKDGLWEIIFVSPADRGTDTDGRIENEKSGIVSSTHQLILRHRECFSFLLVSCLVQFSFLV